MKIRVKPIPGFLCHYADELGNIWSNRPTRWGHPQSRKRKSGLGQDGYLDVVLLRTNGKKANKPVHVLVALAFFGPRPDGMVTTHLNGVKTDNRVVNLAYRSQHENMMDRYRHGTMRVGDKCHSSRVTEEQIREMVAEYKSGASTQRALAKKFGIHHATVSAFCNGRGRVIEVVH